MTGRIAPGVLRGLALAALIAAPAARGDEVPGVATLLQQGRYWQAKNRPDLARQAFRRALALDPTNIAAQQGLAGPKPAPPPLPPPPPPLRMPSAQRPPADTSRKPQAAAHANSAAVAGGAARAAGFQALDASNLDLAARQFERATAQNSRDADALGGMGLVRLKQKRFATARDLLEQATRLGNARQWAPALASAQFFAGLDEARAMLTQGRVPEAQSMAEALARSDYADRALALGLLADIYEREGRFADAADVFRQAGQGDQVSNSRLRSRAARDTALQAAASGDATGAEAAFQSGLQLDQADPWLRYEYARFLLAQGRRPEAEALAETLASSNDPDSLYADALTYSALGQPDTAGTVIARIPPDKRTVQMRDFAIGIKTDIAVARGRQLAAQGRQAEVMSTLRALGALPHMPSAKQAEIAEALSDLGDNEAAAALAQRALGGPISDAQDYEPIIRVLVKTGHDTQAEAALQRAAQVAGTSPDGQKVVTRLGVMIAVGRADTLRLAGQYASAFEVLQAASTTAQGQDNIEILSALARLYQSGGKPVQAVQTFQMVLARSPHDKGALIGLIDTAGAAGDVALARATVTRAVALDPDDYQIYLAAARMEQARGNKAGALKYLKHAQALYNNAAAPGRPSSGNPFANTGSVINPFVQTQPSPAVDPFMLGNRTRFPGDRANAPISLPHFPGLVDPEPPEAATSGSTDPVLTRMQSDIRTLSGESGPSIDIQTGYRVRVGETGLSALKELTGTAQASIGAGNGRLSAGATVVVLDAGQPTGSALARFGRNATAEAQGIVAAEPSALTNAATQHAGGVAAKLAYDSSVFQADIGTTPLGFQDTRIAWRAALSPHFSPTTAARFWVESRPVTDSVLAYAGTRDPVTGAFWGQVMRTGGGASLSHDHNGTGVYGDVSYSRYSGTDTPANHGLQVNVGGYLPLWHIQGFALSGGINLNYQSFSNNQNFFTFGQGGYFSPQGFYAVSFPLRLAHTADRLEINAAVAPGYQSFNQAQEPIYPTDPVAQAALDSLKLKDNDVRSYYDSLSKTGFAISANGSIYYRISTNTRIGGEFLINTFGPYSEFKSTIGIRQTITGGP
jgi:tetratricopeptide (TPR) repeat protein